MHQGQRGTSSFLIRIRGILSSPRNSERRTRGTMTQGLVVLSQQRFDVVGEVVGVFADGADQILVGGQVDPGLGGVGVVNLSRSDRHGSVLPLDHGSTLFSSAWEQKFLFWHFLLVKEG